MTRHFLLGRVVPWAAVGACLVAAVVNWRAARVAPKGKALWWLMTSGFAFAFAFAFALLAVGVIDDRGQWSEALGPAWAMSLVTVWLVPALRFIRERRRLLAALRGDQ